MPRIFWLALCLAGTTLLGACPSPELFPLVGEDPEIEGIIGTSDRAMLRASPLAAAQRLHQALSQEDYDTAWELLASTTRQALDERGAIISASGRELLDASALPTSAGTTRRIRYTPLFFGADVADLKLGGIEGEKGTVLATSRDGEVRTIAFRREDGIWRLHFVDL